MRTIFLDTETTGLEHKLGHRVIEIGGVEMRNRRLTQRHFHSYLNPEREIDAGALSVHGISREFLLDKPRFADIAADFLDFVRGAELVIHNAAFDLGFLNAELALLDMAPVETVCHGVCDTLRMAKELHPGKRNNLNALCERYGVDNSQRTLHGALLDAEILAEVYLAMTRGQESLIMDLADEQTERIEAGRRSAAAGERREQLVRRASPEEIAEHEKLLAAIEQASKGRCLWLHREPAA
ncbi:MAG TPA: DNA polymerase III subunit epsilon [Candidatus Accumulibacter phosphatis]|nr:MAG: DNA polymerase III subunit epsilon [Candidatus Accumulibacter sp. SK-11]HAY29754.1 DNA polymerase III subunit epsilon [Accumulibacter sp.]HCN68968.1 DNA polymerase III subunit epsilon [Accumulibacter sp.]HRL77793.1 DNA polymerase III subunit epsilon [Candidatus Accumulibacter phosphatis]HRQ96325.1 DNA polymerase III subunit epsilon [Candidatus Accumulibacter phosphatis]